jgi:hypothetical protein
MKRKWISEKIESLNPEQEYAQAVDILMNWRDNNPFLQHLIYTMAFIRQVSDPEIAEIVYRNGEGRIIKSAYERANETLHFFGNWYRNGPNSEKGIESINKMNAIHKNFNISNPQYIYTLATILVYPNQIRDLVGLKQRSDNEKKILTNFWKAVGQRMHLVDLPKSYQEFTTYYTEYEKQNFRFSEAGLACCQALIDEFATRWFTKNPAKGVRFLLAHFDDNLKSIFPLDYPNSLVTFFLRKMTYLMGWYANNFKADAQKPQYVEDSFDFKKTHHSQYPKV